MRASTLHLAVVSMAGCCSSACTMTALSFEAAWMSGVYLPWSLGLEWGGLCMCDCGMRGHGCKW